jgi:hypothetical protein
MHFRKFTVGVAALGTLFGVLGITAVSGPAWATTGTGKVNCSHITGTLTFKPALKNGGTSAEVTTVKSTETGCTGGSPTPTKTLGTSIIRSSNNNCSNLASSRSVTVKLTYTPVVTGSTFSGTSTPVLTNPPGFSLSGTVTGSYPSTNSTASVTLKQTDAQILAACKSTLGLKSLTIASGSSQNG